MLGEKYDHVVMLKLKAINQISKGIVTIYSYH